MALAEAASARGMAVTLALGPGAASPSSGTIRVLRFTTAGSLRDLLAEHAWPGADPMPHAVIQAAAVADYRPSVSVSGKLRRMSERLTLELEPVPDIVAGLAAAHAASTWATVPPPLLVAFALEETERLEEAAARKLAQKGVDAIVANPLETMEAAGVDGLLLWRDSGRVEGPGETTKARFAEWLITQLEPAVRARAAGDISA